MACRAGAVKHIAFLIPSIDKLGGAEGQVIRLAQGLARRGWRMSVVALSGSGGHAAQELMAGGVGFATLRMRKGIADPRGWIALQRWIRRETPDVLHAHLPHASWMARGARLLAPVRVMIDTLHTSATGTSGRRLGYRMTGWLSDCVTAVSQGAADAHVKARMVRRERMTVLPNGVDVSEWQPDPCVRERMRNELGVKDDFLWFAAGRLEPVKDYPAMLHALAGLPESARLVVAGGGSQEASLRRLTESLGLAQRVQFLGFVPDVRRWMQAADGFVLSSLWEGLPLGLLEAAACGLPCAATAVAGTRDAVVDGQTGYLAESQNVNSLKRAMARLMHMPPEGRRSMGIEARQRVVEQFSLVSVLDRWEALYCELLDANPLRRRFAGRPHEPPIDAACKPGRATNARAGMQWR
jgi:glycosyltransferase involved in cell wall biosynthesis